MNIYLLIFFNDYYFFIFLKKENILLFAIRFESTLQTICTMILIFGTMIKTATLRCRVLQDPKKVGTVLIAIASGRSNGKQEECCVSRLQATDASIRENFWRALDLVRARWSEAWCIGVDFHDLRICICG